MKRTSQVALLLMGATGIGVGANALTSPRANCMPGATPGIQGMPAVQPCPPGGSSSSSGSRSTYYGGHWSRPIFGGFTPASATPSGSVPLAGRSSGPSAPGGAISGTSRGGFGSTGHAMASSSS